MKFSLMNRTRTIKLPVLGSFDKILFQRVRQNQHNTQRKSIEQLWATDMYINLAVQHTAVAMYFSGHLPLWDLQLPCLGLAEIYQKFATSTLPLYSFFTYLCLLFYTKSIPERIKACTNKLFSEKPVRHKSRKQSPRQ